MRFRLLVFISIILLGFPPTAFSDSTQRRTPIAQSGSTLISSVLRNSVVNIRISTLRLEKDSNNAFPSSLPSDVRTVTIVQSLDIYVDGQSLFVPRSVIADLIDAREASVQYVRGVFVLSIGGGDGADSYFVRVYFDTMKIFRRKLYSSLIPNKVAQDTHYWLHMLKDK